MVSEFLEKNRKYEVLGMFILLIVGVVLFAEGGVAAAHANDDHHLHWYGHSHWISHLFFHCCFGYR